MDIRLASHGDLDSINRIYNQAVRQRFCTAHLTPVSMEKRIEWFNERNTERYPVFVSETDNRITGWVSLGAYRTGRQALAHVAEVSYYVDKNQRNRGIGTALLHYAIEAAPSYNFSVLIALLLSRNPASIALLEKFGFLCWGQMPGIAKIDHQWADHLYYGLKL